MNELSQSIMAECRPVAQGLISGCKDCDGTNLVFECSEYGHVKRSEVYEVRGTDASGLSHDKCGFTVEFDSDNTCPTCAPVRELDFKQHYWETWDENGEWKCACGYVFPSKKRARAHESNHFHTNPDLTRKLHDTPDGPVWYVRHVLEVLGKWDKFVEWVNPISPVLSCTGGQGNGYHLSSDEINKFAKITSNGKWLCENIDSFFKEGK